MITKVLGCIVLGIYLAEKGYVAFDTQTGEINVRAMLLVIICVGIWLTFCNIVLGL